jgi:ribosomal protein L7Ae-like RNA K-turn-binding protein
MRQEKASSDISRLFPFILRARKLIVGREALLRSRRKLQLVLITTDISEGSREEILREFRDYPVLQHFTSADLQEFFGIRNAKVIGFAKSGLAKSIYAGLKQHRINQPAKSAGATG